jgi:hypothetical protein
MEKRYLIRKMPSELHKALKVEAAMLDLPLQDYIIKILSDRGKLKKSKGNGSI